jgi:thymidylate synthase (FAD)
MTFRREIDFENDTRYVPVLDHGFVGLVDYMGSDSAIVQAARVSYGEGTKSINTDRGLIRYLMKHEHTTPFEMCEVKFHIKLPIFVMRQLVRHRTASMNEYSARYSVITDEFYIPDRSQLKEQSTNNKQGRDEDLGDVEKEYITDSMEKLWDYNYNTYKYYIDTYNLARESARTVLPVGCYTECYWKANLKNFLHMARLRMDPHAQYEIREFADAMYNLVKPLFPIACEAFEDYQVTSTKVSGPEIPLLRRLISRNAWLDIIEDCRTEENIANMYGLSKRELEDFKNKWIC